MVDVYDNIIAARDAYWEAGKALERIVELSFPPGSEVEWMWGEHEFAGVVVRHLYGGDMIVENYRTGKERKISYGHILAAMGIS